MLTQEILKQYLHYNPETGIFTWINNSSNKYKKLFGKKAGCSTPSRGGVVCIRILGTLYFAHRLAFLYQYGNFPIMGIDHIDGNPSNNNIYNIREASDGQNHQNLKKHKKHNKSGFLGVETLCNGNLRKNPYSSRIRLNGVAKYLGMFKTPEEAHEAYLKAKREIHPFNTL